MRRPILLLLLLLVLSSASTWAQLIQQAPTQYLHKTFLSNNTRYSPGICGLTVNCSPFDYRWPAGPVATQSSPCYENIDESTYRAVHNVPAEHTITSADFAGFSCDAATSNARCGRAPRMFGENPTSTQRWLPNYQSTTCVCLDPCWTGPTCTTPVIAPLYYYGRLFAAERRQGFEDCIRPFQLANWTYWSDRNGPVDFPSIFYPTGFSFKTPIDPSINTTYAAVLRACGLQWLTVSYPSQFDSTNATDVAFINQIQTNYRVAQCINPPPPCSIFPGGGCGPHETCQRRLKPTDNPAVLVDTLVSINGQDVNIPMVPQDVCCTRGWGGLNCDIDVGCSLTGCDHNGTCLSTTTDANTGLTIPLTGSDIRCIGCDPGWTGRFCNVSAPMYTTNSSSNTTAHATARRLLQTQSGTCDVVRSDMGYRSNAAGAIYPEPGRACDCGVVWHTQSVGANTTSFYRVLVTGNYDNDFSQRRSRLLSPAKYPSTGLGLNPQSSRPIRSTDEARYLCYQDFLCDGFYVNFLSTRVIFFSLLASNSSQLDFVPDTMHLVDRLSAPKAYNAYLCTNATLDPDWYCQQHPIQCNSVRITGGVGNMQKSTNLTVAEAAELHFRAWGHQVRNAPNANCQLTTDWTEDVSTCVQPLRCVPAIAARVGSLDNQRCGNLTYLNTLDPLHSLLQRLDTYPSPFIATIGTPNNVSEHGLNNTCSCVAPFRSSNLSTYDDCALDMCGVSSGQGLVNASHVGLPAAPQSCTCQGIWTTDNSTCNGQVCQWCQASMCANFGTATQNGTCQCTSVFSGLLCDQPVCNASTTNIQAMLRSSKPLIDCSDFCVSPWQGPFCNVTSCVHGIRSYDGAFQCICPDDYYKDPVTGTCNDLFCVAGHGLYTGNGTCACIGPWTGARCDQHVCGHGSPVQNPVDGSWECQCNWPWTNQFLAIGTVNTTWGACNSHLCGDWGYPSSLNWTEPVDACDCKRNGVGQYYNTFEMGIFTSPLECTGPSYAQCRKPCVQADCQLSKVANYTAFKPYDLVATVTKVDGQPVCVCPLAYQMSIAGDSGHACRPFIPCTANNRTLVSVDVNGNVVCECKGTVDTGYYTSSPGTALCDIYHPPPPPPALNVNGSVVIPPAPPQVQASSSIIPGLSNTAFYTMVSLAAAVVGTAVVGTTATATGAGTAIGAGVAKAVAATQSVVVNVMPGAASQATAAVAGKGRRLKSFNWFGGWTKKGYSMVVLLAIVFGMDVCNAQWGAQCETIVESGLRVTARPCNGPAPSLSTLGGTVAAPTLDSLYTTDVRQSAWAYNGAGIAAPIHDWINVDLTGYKISAPEQYGLGSPGFVFDFDTQCAKPTSVINSYSLQPAGSSSPLVQIGFQRYHSSDVLISEWARYDRWAGLACQMYLPGSALQCASAMYDQYRDVNLCGIPGSSDSMCGGHGVCVVPGPAGLNSARAWSTDSGAIISNADPPSIISITPVYFPVGKELSAVHGCQCDNGWTGRRCDKQCKDYSYSQLNLCYNRGTCSGFTGPNVPGNLMTRGSRTSTCSSAITGAGAMQYDTCQCSVACDCQKASDGVSVLYDGDQCQFAMQTKVHEFTKNGVTDYTVCCMPGSTDCAPRWNPLIGDRSICTVPYALGSHPPDKCYGNWIDSQTGLPLFTEFLAPADVCRQNSKAGVCWQGQRQIGQNADSTKTFCWCNQAVTAYDTPTKALSQDMRGFYGPTCSTITCTQKTIEWPEGVLQTLGHDGMSNAERCSGNYAVGITATHSDDTHDTMCDDRMPTHDSKGRGYRDALAAAIAAAASNNNTEPPIDDSWYRYWRINTQGDCFQCKPGYGMFPIDWRELSGTEYHDRNVVHFISRDGKVTAQENWNGLCHAKTFHGADGQACGGYGTPIYGKSFYFKRKAPSVGYKEIRSVVGCICPEGTVVLESGICQRAVALDGQSADGIVVLPAGKAGCSFHGQARTLSDGMNSVCSCNVALGSAWNGPNCEIHDPRLYGRSSTACDYGQFTYYNSSAVTDRTTRTSAQDFPDMDFQYEVLEVLGTNKVDRRKIPKRGYYNASLTQYVNTVLFPNPIFFTAAQDPTASTTWNTLVSLPTTGGTALGFPDGVYIGLTTPGPNVQYVWGRFDDVDYQTMYPDVRDNWAGSGWNHYAKTGIQEGRMASVFTDLMPDPQPGPTYVGQFDVTNTQIVNTQLVYNTYFVTNRMGVAYTSIVTGDYAYGDTMPMVMLGVSWSTPSGTAYGHGLFDWQDYLKRYPSTTPQTPNGAWNDFITRTQLLSGVWNSADFIARTKATPIQVRLPQELVGMANEINSPSYSQFGCKCTDQSQSAGRVTINNKCVFACNTPKMSPNGLACSGNGHCLDDPTSNDAVCLCDLTPGRGGLACEETTLTDRAGQLCGGTDRGSIVMPTKVYDSQSCACKAPYYRCTDRSCLIPNICIQGQPDCSDPGLNFCSSSNKGVSTTGVMGFCGKNSTQGDNICVCRAGAFAGSDCSQPITPSLKTASGLLLSCTGRGVPDPAGSGFCLCDEGTVGDACQIDIRNRQCTFASGEHAQPYLDIDSNGLVIV